MTVLGTRENPKS